MSRLRIHAGDLKTAVHIAVFIRDWALTPVRSMYAPLDSPGLHLTAQGQGLTAKSIILAM